MVNFKAFMMFVIFVGGSGAIVAVMFGTDGIEYTLAWLIGALGSSSANYFAEWD